MRESVTMSARFITQLIRKNSGRFHHHLPGRRSIMNEVAGLDVTVLEVVISELSSPKVPNLYIFFSNIHVSLECMNSKRCNNGKYELTNI